MEGKIKFFNEQKGYGFVIDNQTGADYFVHTTKCLDKVKKDDMVSYEVEESKKGFVAVNVKRIG